MYNSWIQTQLIRLIGWFLVIRQAFLEAYLEVALNCIFFSIRPWYLLHKHSLAKDTHNCYHIFCHNGFGLKFSAGSIIPCTVWEKFFPFQWNCAKVFSILHSLRSIGPILASLCFWSSVLMLSVCLRPLFLFRGCVFLAYRRHHGRYCNLIWVIRLLNSVTFCSVLLFEEATDWFHCLRFRFQVIMLLQRGFLSTVLNLAD